MIQDTIMLTALAADIGNDYRAWLGTNTDKQVVDTTVFLDGLNARLIITYLRLP